LQREKTIKREIEIETTKRGETTTIERERRREIVREVTKGDRERERLQSQSEITKREGEREREIPKRERERLTRKRT
jgi:hypothetical protein